MGDTVRDEGYDDWLDALAAGDGYYVACENGHGTLPPRRICPHCGSRELGEEPLPETGTVLAQTRVHVPAPSFSDDAPYTTAVVDFGAVRLTGLLRPAEQPPSIENGATVRVSVDETAQGERVVVFDDV